MPLVEMKAANKKQIDKTRQTRAKDLSVTTEVGPHELVIRVTYPGGFACVSDINDAKGKLVVKDFLHLSMEEGSAIEGAVAGALHMALVPHRNL